MSDILRVSNLVKTFRKPVSFSFKRKEERSRTVNALKGINFSLPAGCITGFLGANGAGKTTTIKCLFGLAFPDSGEVSFFGNPKLTRETKAKIGFLPERPYFYEYLTGREFLRFYGELAEKMTSTELRDRINQLLKRVGLEHASDRPLRSYSKGMLQRIGIAQALIHRPELIILDEPMTGLDPDGRFEVREIIRETARNGTTVFFSSHLLPDAEQLCDRLVILKKGELVYQGSTTGLLKQTELQNKFTVTTRQGERTLSEDVEGIDELQRRIDVVRAGGAKILEVTSGRVTLEEAFVKIAMGDSNRGFEGDRK